MTRPSTPPPAEIYLGKQGRTYGPYSPEQLDALRATPDYLAYRYVWDERDEQPAWRTLPHTRAHEPGLPPTEALPAHDLSGAASAAAVAFGAARGARGAAGSPVPTQLHDLPGLEALCHDSRHVVTGVLIRAHAAGCELRCEGPTMDFGARAPVTLNLLDPRSGQAMNVRARLGGVSREGGRWNLRIHWDICPELISRHLAKAA